MLTSIGWPAATLPADSRSTHGSPHPRVPGQLTGEQFRVPQGTSLHDRPLDDRLPGYLESAGCASAAGMSVPKSRETGREGPSVVNLGQM